MSFSQRSMKPILRFLLSAAVAGMFVGVSVPAGLLLGVALLFVVPRMLDFLWSIDGKRAAWKGFAFAYLVGAVSFAIQLRWLTVVSPIGAVALPLYLAL